MGLFIKITYNLITLSSIIKLSGN